MKNSDKVDGLIAEFHRRKEAGESITSRQFIAQHADSQDELIDYFDNEQFFARVSNSFRDTLGANHPADADETGNAIGMENESTFGDYEILYEVARGGMGVVYRARQKKLNRDVAIKMILTGKLASEDDIQRFLKEAEAAGNLDHPGIVPVYDVGKVRGHYFFSMAFIEGKSLSEQLIDGPLNPENAAKIARQIALAVQHAHERGIIHRDLKPANILLDSSHTESSVERSDRLHHLGATHRPFDLQPRITDFGLAKHVDAQRELTATGQILGTPSYMPPEQAIGDVDKIRESSDVYSIGAILYAMLTGRPPIQADNPVDTVMQVATQEPVPLRQLNPTIPKDLETVCLKCLEKSQDGRFQSAQELADELECFLEGRPIQSRRIGLIENARRWFVGQRRSVVASLLAFVSILLCIVSAIVAQKLISQAQLGQFSIKTDHPPLVVEVMDDVHRSVMEPVTLPSSRPIRLPAKDHHLRIHADGRLSQDFIARAPKSSTLHVKANLQDQVCWNTLEIERTFVTVRLDNKNDIVDLTNSGIRRISGSTKKILWEQPLAGDTAEIVRRMPGCRWPWTKRPQPYGGLGKYQEEPFIQPIADIDGDSHDDILVAAQHQAWTATLSGATGELIWSVQRSIEIEKRIDDAVSYNRSRVVKPPQQIGDINGDNVDDLAFTFAARDEAGTIVDRTGKTVPLRWLEVLSGLDGTPLWKKSISSRSFHSTSKFQIPYDFRWFSQSGGTSSSSGTVNRHRNYFSRRLGGTHQRTGAEVYLPDVVGCVKVAAQTTFVLVNGMNVECYDPKTGETLGSTIKLPFRPNRTAIVADVNSDGSDELVFLHQLSEDENIMKPPATIFVWSLAENRLLWSLPIQAVRLINRHWRVPRADWPKVVDLDRDGRFEIVTPCGTSSGTYEESPSWGAVGVFDAASGKPKWEVRLPTLDPQIDHFQIVPDVNSDGIEEILAATISPKNDAIFVDCLSGKDGTKIWANRSPFPFDANERTQLWIADTFLWNAHQNGSIVVQTVPNLDHDVAPTTFTFDLKTGTPRGTGQNVLVHGFTDLDNDGLDELVSYRPWDDYKFDNGGRVDALKQMDNVRWRRIGGRRFYPTQDLDGGGLPDLINWDVDVLSVISGESGRTIWLHQDSQIGSGTFAYRDTTPVVAIPDINGDGIAELLMPIAPHVRRRNYRPIRLISGRTGREIWTGGRETVEQHPIKGHVTADFDQDGVLDVAVLSAQTDQSPTGGLDRKVWLMAISGVNGALHWSRQLADGPLSVNAWVRHIRQIPGSDEPNDWISIGRMNKDFFPDLVGVFGGSDDGFEVRAVDGRNGQTLWSKPLLRRKAGQDLEKICVAVVETPEEPTDNLMILENHEFGTSLTCRNGSDGEQLWTWSQSVAAGKKRGSSYDSHRPRLHFLATTEPDKKIAVNLSTSIVILNARGDLVAEKKLSSPRRPFNIWPADIDNDGNDEIIARPHALLVINASTGEEIWRSPQKGSFRGEIKSIIGCPGKAPMIVAQQRLSSTETELPSESFIGINSRTGKTDWQSKFPVPRAGRDPAYMRNALLLPDKDPQNRIYGVFTSEQRTVCLSIIDKLPSRGGGSKTMAIDERLVRPFPVRNHLTPTPFHSYRQKTRSFFWAIYAPFFLIAVPFLFVRKSLRYRTWNLKSLMLLPFIFGLFLIVIRVPPPHLDPSVPATWGTRLLNAALCLPIWFVIFGFVRWLRNRQWKMVLTWGFAVASIAGFLSYSWISSDSSSLGGPKAYDWSGVHVVWLTAVFLSGWLIFVLDVGRIARDQLS